MCLINGGIFFYFNHVNKWIICFSIAHLAFYHIIDITMKFYFVLASFLILSINVIAEPLVGKEDTSFLSASLFGAKGNGKSDDTGPLLLCFDSATRQKGIVVVTIPYGIYKISKTLICNIGHCSQLIIRGLSRNGKKPLIESDKFITILEIYSYYWSPKGKVTISGLSIKGNNLPFSSTHPYYDKPAFCSGIHLLNLKDVKVVNNEVNNIYGNGIFINYSNLNLNDLNNRFDLVIVAENEVLNCWGLHPTQSKNGTFDDYGDGIYINSAKKGQIYNNEIINNIRETRQFGRAGLVLETNDEDCQVRNNYIEGYDRNIHLEGDIGGHIIANNTLEDSDFGILIYDVPTIKIKPIKIISNKISNKGLFSSYPVVRIRNSDERCLLSFYAKDGCRNGSEILDNQFEIDSSYAYKFSAVTRFLATGLIIKGNDFISDTRERKSVNFYLPVDSIVANRFKNVDVHFAKQWSGQVINSNKLLGLVRTNIHLQ